MGPIPTQLLCSYEEEMNEDSHTTGKMNDMKTWGDGGHLQAKGTSEETCPLTPWPRGPNLQNTGDISLMLFKSKVALQRTVSPSTSFQHST